MTRLDTRPSTVTFVLGAAHSGTTILYRMLAMHPDLGWPSQFSLRDGSVPGRRRVPGMTRIDRLLRRWTTPDWRKRESTLHRYTVPRPGEARTLWNHALAPGIGSDESVRRVRRVLALMAERQDRSHLVVKLPTFHRHLEVLREVSPGAHFVHIVRDGRAVALSLEHKFARDPGLADPLAAAADHWVEVVESVAGHADRTCELRYEDLCASVPEALRAVLGHAGLDATTFPYERCPQRLEPTNHRWLDDVSPERLRTMESRQGPWLAHFGYGGPDADGGG